MHQTDCEQVQLLFPFPPFLQDKQCLLNVLYVEGTGILLSSFDLVTLLVPAGTEISCLFHSIMDLQNRHIKRQYFSVQSALRFNAP